MNQNCFYLCLLKSRWHRLSRLYKLSLEPRLMWGQTDMYRTEQKNHRLQIASTEYLTWTQFLCLYLLNMSDMKRFFSYSFSLRLFSGMSNENHVFIFIGRYQRLTPRRKTGFKSSFFFFDWVISVESPVLWEHFCMWIKNTANRIMQLIRYSRGHRLVYHCLVIQHVQASHGNTVFNDMIQTAGNSLPVCRNADKWSKRAQNAWERVSEGGVMHAMIWRCDSPNPSRNHWEQAKVWVWTLGRGCGAFSS